MVVISTQQFTFNLVSYTKFNTMNISYMYQRDNPAATKIYFIKNNYVSYIDCTFPEKQTPPGQALILVFHSGQEGPSIVIIKTNSILSTYAINRMS